MTEKRFELKSWNHNKLQAKIYDNQEERQLILSLYEIIELLNKVSQSEYDLKGVGSEIQDKLDELFKKGNIEKQLLEDIRHELVSIDKWYAFEKWYAFKPTSYINTEKEFLQLDFDNLIKRIDKELIE